MKYSSIRSLHSIHGARRAIFATSCHINQFVSDLSQKIKCKTDGQCTIRTALFTALDEFPADSLPHPSPIALLSRKIHDIYRPLNSIEKLSFFKILAEYLPPNKQSGPDTFSSTRQLSEVPTSPAPSPCSTLLHSLALCREGLEFVLRIKTDLKSLNLPDRDCLNQFEHTLYQVVSFWSRQQFLNFKRVTTKSSEELKKNIIRAEAVHPMYSRGEFDMRVSRGRCYTVTHTQLSPHVPLSMVYCAPIDYLPTHIQPLLNTAGFRSTSTPNSPNTACFYTISNAHAGFGGTEVAHQLIKYAVRSLQHEFPSLNNFLTLSPIPQFRKWLSNDDIVNQEFSRYGLERFAAKERSKLLKLCAHYLANIKKGKHALDPVANFHLKNGASLWKINWLANPNERGMSQSYGIMANYLYDLENLESNRMRYLNEGVVNISELIQILL